MTLNITDYLLRTSYNTLRIDLYEDGELITVSPTEIYIELQDWRKEVALTITRSPTGNGITYSNGRITVIPAELTEDLTVLRKTRLYRALIRIKTAGEPGGVWYGHDDTNERYHWLVQE